MFETKTDGETAAKIAALLLQIQAVKLNTTTPFIWASGWHSPIYCDNRLTLGYPTLRDTIKNALVDKVKSYFPNCEAIAGVATAGIPQGALVADALDLPFLYVRSKPKGHGLENLIEGRVLKGQQVVVLEDLISTGGSSLKAVSALREAQFEVLGLAAIFTYGFDIAKQNFEDAEVPWISLSNYQYLLDYAASQGMIDAGQMESLQNWRKQPDTWKAP